MIQRSGRRGFGRRGIVLTLSAAALSLALGTSVAGACTGTSFVALGPTQVTETGRQLNADVFAGPELENTKVDLRLVEGDATTTVLASGTAAKGGTISLPVTVPDLAPGVHYLALESGGKVLSRTEFQVLDRGGSSAALAAAELPRDLAVRHGSSLLNPGFAVAGAGLLAVAAFAVATSRRRRVPSAVHQQGQDSRSIDV